MIHFHVTSFLPISFNSSHKIFYTISIQIQSLRNHKFLAQGNKSRCVCDCTCKKYPHIQYTIQFLWKIYAFRYCFDFDLRTRSIHRTLLKYNFSINFDLFRSIQVLIIFLFNIKNKAFFSSKIQIHLQNKTCETYALNLQIVSKNEIVESIRYEKSETCVWYL